MGQIKIAGPTWGSYKWDWLKLQVLLGGHINTGVTEIDLVEIVGPNWRSHKCRGHINKGVTYMKIGKIAGFSGGYTIIRVTLIIFSLVPKCGVTETFMPK